MEDELLVVADLLVEVVVLVCGPQFAPEYTAVMVVVDDIDIGAGSCVLPVKDPPLQ